MAVGRARARNRRVFCPCISSIRLHNATRLRHAAWLAASLIPQGGQTVAINPDSGRSTPRRTPTRAGRAIPAGPRTWGNFRPRHARHSVPVPQARGAESWSLSANQHSAQQGGDGEEKNLKTFRVLWRRDSLHRPPIHQAHPPHPIFNRVINRALGQHNLWLSRCGFPYPPCSTDRQSSGVPQRHSPKQVLSMHLGERARDPSFKPSQVSVKPHAQIYSLSHISSPPAASGSNYKAPVVVNHQNKDAYAPVLSVPLVRPPPHAPQICSHHASLLPPRKHFPSHIPTDRHSLNNLNLSR